MMSGISELGHTRRAISKSFASCAASPSTFPSERLIHRIVGRNRMTTPDSGIFTRFP